ncbi:MAG: thioredoxin [Deltaproteobacteria bacterium HGW-Deltaproteobacteria-13]|jgi:thioredoxin 1|nr:MAG: thioredoxin [Deltaproteobacteria bacterium HGW-Deltaproteobacteria-13]
MSKQELVKHADDSNFETMVLRANKLVLVDFWAPWCGPCRAIGPILEELAGAYGDQVNVVKVNVDDNPKISAQYGVRSIPTLLIMKDGTVKDTTVGMASKNQLADLINRNLN